ncbi:winged helix-turn-helix transcriptional regulator [Liquorilactobacillus capillatus]|uniref:Cinnamoyl ester hydrolase-like protein n=1 Tax=Liquorilactobacillus capillatus DSM 19910 TaxID=1423731 RepID=A0A0R1M7B9_9LACO|nr:helix-turn-helix domain-containing protein [Liquorilactobacillus capillatus]KRL00818.1 cinnamoyl ester hydrolase-like protein [Liquorilactobacillus capillatus DSM 19910]
MQRHIYACQDGCPVQSTLQIIAGKWKAVILYHFFKDGICHFGELQREIQACSSRMLALQLNELEEDGVISKNIYSTMPLKTDYTLTEFGKTLEPVIDAMAAWGNHYNQTIAGAEDFSQPGACRWPVDVTAKSKNK